MNHSEFEHKIIIHRHKLFRFAKQILENAPDAEDAVQETFIKLWKIREKLAEYQSTEALAMITLKNTCLDKLKTRKVRLFLDNESLNPENVAVQPTVEYKEISEAIENAIARLPKIQQLIVHLRDVEGYEFSEISPLVEMNEQAVRTALSRARQKLRELLVDVRN